MTSSSQFPEGAQAPGADGARASAQGGGEQRAALGLVVLIGAMLLVRLATLGSYPLMDTSEARYGEIARVMLTTGNWITPQEVPGTPFWAKPPLYAWLAAGSMRLLGVHEFALRLPSFLCALGVLALCAGWSDSVARARDAGARRMAVLLTLGVLSTSVLFFVAAGAVMTDPTLALCVTWMLAAFHHCVIRSSREALWRWGFFVAAGFGMLAKGPVILLYAGAPIGLWTIWERRFAHLWRALPWVWGTVLSAAICVPWYAAAEERTPGFLQYFLLGEHVMRFLKPGWGGDLYGTAHAEPLGMIWLYLAGALGLGTVLLAAALVIFLRGGAHRAPWSIGAEQRFLLLASFVPVVFFTFAGNIIWTYVLPALGPLCVFVADVLAPKLEAARRWRAVVFATLCAAALSVSIAVVAWVPRHVARHSSAQLVEEWRERSQPPGATGEIVYVGRRAPASLRFYARGSVRTVEDLGAVLPAGASAGRWVLALAPDRVEEVRRFAQAQPGAWTVQTIGSNTDLALVEVLARPGAATR